MTAIFSVQNTVNHDRHLQCAEHRQFSPSCRVCRTQTVLTVMLYVQNRQLSPSCCASRTDNSHCHFVCAEHRQFAQRHVNVVSAEHRQFCHVECAEHRQTDHRQFSPSCCVSEHRQFSLSCCVCRTQTNRTQTSLTVMLCVKNTDNSHRHVVCAEHRQFSPSCCVQNTDKQSTDNSHRHVVCRIQTKRTQTILTVILCVQNTVGRWCGHVHQRCRRLRVVTVAPAQSAVPAQSVTLLPIGQSVLTHHVFSGTRMDRR